MLEGRDKETKEKIIKGVTKVFTDMGVPANAVTVVLREIPKDNWGSAGEQSSKMCKR